MPTRPVRAGQERRLHSPVKVPSRYLGGEELLRHRVYVLRIEGDHVRVSAHEYGHEEAERCSAWVRREQIVTESAPLHQIVAEAIRDLPGGARALSILATVGGFLLILLLILLMIMNAFGENCGTGPAIRPCG